MAKHVLVLSGWLLLLGCTPALHAQNNTIAGGGNASGPGGSVSFSIGQIDYISASGTEGTITQGIQQPFEILVTSGTGESAVELIAGVAPNPTSGSVVLQITAENFAEMRYTLYNAAGVMIEQQPVTGQETIITLMNQTNGIYFLTVEKDSQSIKTFKIVKNF